MYVLRRHHWTAPMLLCVSALVAMILVAPPARAAAGTDTLWPGESLEVGGQLVSPNGQYTVSISDGNLVVFRAGFGVRYRSGQQSPDAGASLALGSDGNLILRTGDGEVRWQAVDAGASEGRLIIRNDGNLKLHDASGAIVWATNTASPQQLDTMLPTGASLVSLDGSSVAAMQRDGNLVVRKSDKIVWASGTTQPGSRAVLTPSLGLVVVSMNNRILWSSRTPVAGEAALGIGDDGNLVLYSGDRAVWQSYRAPAVNCDSVTGPVPIEDTVVAFNGTRVHACLRGQYEEMVRAAARDGVTLAGSGWRDINRQIELRIQNCGGNTYYNIYEKPSSACSPPTAIPGRSMHERGLAIDFNAGGRAITSSDPQFKWLAANASRYGLYNLPSESWHWSTNGR